MYFDLKIISTNCKYGPIEILENGTLGELIPTESPINLARAIEKVAYSSKKINYKKSLERFSCKKIMEQYEKLKYK